MTTRAKFRCHSITDFGTSKTVKLGAVYPDKDSPENKAFWQNTPSGTLEISITNPEAFGIFAVGADYYLDISRA